MVEVCALQRLWSILYKINELEEQEQQTCMEEQMNLRGATNREIT
jgi:hypothetical protein